MMNKSNYKLKNEARKRDNNTCQKCGFHYNDINLDVHHIKPLGFNGEDKLDNMITLCRKCHNGAPLNKDEFYTYLETDELKDYIEKHIDDNNFRELIKEHMNEIGQEGNEEVFIYNFVKNIFNSYMIDEYEYYRFAYWEGIQKAKELGVIGQPKKDIDVNKLREERLKSISTRPTWTQLEKDFGCNRVTLISRLKEEGYWDEENRCVQ